MILLDTHIGIWWVDGTPLPADYDSYLRAEAPGGLGVAAISCWEVAKLVSRGRLQLKVSVDRWIAAALAPPVRLLPLSPRIAVVRLDYLVTSTATRPISSSSPPPGSTTYRWSRWTA